MDTYTPNPSEKFPYDAFWKIVNPSGSLELSGGDAVPFFQKSGIDNGILRQIWSLSTPGATMNLQQFYTALRFISMVQNGEIPISKERLATSKSATFSLPKFAGVQIPVPPTVSGIIFPTEL